MIIVKLMGGLGNQMFQYAAGRYLAHLRDTELKLDLSFLEAEAKSYTKREFELDIFNIKADRASTDETNTFKKFFSNRYRRFLFRKFPFLFSKAYITESGNHFRPEFLNYPKDTYLEGFWQSEKYFKGISDLIRADFSFKEPLSGLNRELADKINLVQSVSLHVRRGDYIINEQVQNYHGVCSPAYYKEGVAKIQSQIKNPELFIFSDDSEWCKQNLIFDLPCTYIDHNTGKKSFEDMRLMSLCKHNIIANSSFSWWGAWLNKNTEKIVIIPKKWFNDPTHRSEDIYPEKWIRQ
ncbi:MAG: alpha-1,2-fucosyltransferase [Bacteroidia bacterium]